MKRLGLYLHIPFCRSKCLYCDFYSLPHPTREAMERYVDALCRDLQEKAQDCSACVVDTVYFGGGTPTLLPAELTERILDTVAARYRLSENAEISAECNPATASREQLCRLRRAGWNRLSVGIQSAQPGELRALGRLHSFADAEQLFSDARVAGFSNLSADLMFGIPEQTPESWLSSLEAVLSLSPTHLSFYGLTIEEGTPFAKSGNRLPLPGEEETRQMYLEGIRMCASHGLAQYEISNFAKPGYECRHNLKYWNCEEYLGFGPAAFSDFSGVRSGNSRDLSAYIENRSIRTEEERPSEKERMNEYIMLRLRLSAGIREADFFNRFRFSFQERYREKLLPFCRMKLLTLTKDRCALTPEGFYVSNAILSELVEFGSV